MPNLEQALRELEIATAAVAGISLEDIEAARAILKRRSKAIARLAGFRGAALALPAAALQEVVIRLNPAAGAGEAAQRQLERSKGGVTAEWSRWNRVHRALGSAGRARATKVDCSG
jgi:hypothetical protein